MIHHFLERTGKASGRALRLAPSAMRALLAYPWPGNVRELENAIEYATTVCEGQTIHLGDLPIEVGSGSGPRVLVPGDLEHDPTLTDARIGPSADVPHPQASELSDLSPPQTGEVARIRSALEQARYRREEAASILGMSRTTLWRKMKEYRL